jgi:hypothetical protein
MDGKKPPETLVKEACLLSSVEPANTERVTKFYICIVELLGTSPGQDTDCRGWPLSIP